MDGKYRSACDRLLEALLILLVIGIEILYCQQSELHYFREKRAALEVRCFEND